MTEKLIKSKERVKKHAEVFTPEWVVKEMCDCLEKEGDPDVFKPEKTFLEPAVGTGNFLVEILERKFKYCKDFKDVCVAVNSMYGIDIQADNIEECRERLFQLTLKLILEKNIVVGDFLKDDLDVLFNFRKELINDR